MVQVKLFVACILAAAAITSVAAAPVNNVNGKVPKKSTPPDISDNSTPEQMMTIIRNARMRSKRMKASRSSFEERRQKIENMMDNAVPSGSKTASHPSSSSSSVQPENHHGQGTPGSTVTEHSPWAPSSSSSLVQPENHHGQGTPGSTVTEHSQAPSSSSSLVQPENHHGQGTPGSTVTEHSQAAPSSSFSSSSSVQHENHQGQGTPGSTVTEHSQAPSSSSSSVQPENRPFNQGHWQGTHWLAQSNFVRKT